MAAIRRTLSLALAPLALVAVAHAAPTTVTSFDRNGSNTVILTSTPFTSVASSIFTTDLNGAAIVKVSGSSNFESVGSVSGDLTLDLGGVGTATLSGGNGQLVNLPGTTANLGRYSVGANTSQYWEVSAGASFTVSFQQLVNAFSFYATDLGDFDGTVTLELLDTAGKTIGSKIDVPTATGNSANGSLLFFGLYAIDTADNFKAIRFTTSGTPGVNDSFGFDNFFVGAADSVTIPTEPRDLPEPLSLALVGTALAALPLARRRRA